MFHCLDLDQRAFADQTFCTWEQGWRSLQLRRFTGHREVEEAAIPPMAEHAIVLVSRGEVAIESGADGRWRGARYSPGTIALTAPNRPVRLRWRTVSPEPHETLQMHLPASTTARMVEELWDRDPARVALPDTLATTDPVLEQIMLGLLRAAEEGVPDLYAETAAEFVVAHILVRHGALPPPRILADDERVRRARVFLRENLHRPVSLAEVAAEAGMSRYHFLRVFRRQTGVTPLRYLTRLRIEQAGDELTRGAGTISEIAYRYGFANPAHFSTAFRRQTGLSPTAYRRSHGVPAG